MSVTLRMADGDLFINSAGRAEEVSGADKTAQDLAEVLMTPLDPLRSYGSELADLSIPQPVSLFVGKALISKKVDEAIQRLKRMQERDPYAGPDERIDKINRLLVEEIESREFIFWVNVLLVDKTIIGNRILAVSLRHQESARLIDSVQELADRLKRLS